MWQLMNVVGLVGAVLVMQVWAVHMERGSRGREGGLVVFTVSLLVDCISVWYFTFCL